MRPVLNALVLSVALAACGGGGSSGDSSPPPNPSPEVPGATFTIAIRNMAFVPASLDVTPGATVVVRNEDSMPHSVTSEDAPDAFTPGGVAGVSFDTGLFFGQRSFTIPATAAPGTTVPYYCQSHGAQMIPANGTIRIVATASQQTPSPEPPAGPSY